MSIIAFYIATASREEANRMALTLLEEKLIACANILGEATSLYVWEGKLCDTPETIVIAKTTTVLAEKAVARARELHSYECPCIVTWPITGGYAPFLEWVEAEVKPAKPA